MTIQKYFEKKKKKDYRHICSKRVHLPRFYQAGAHDYFIGSQKLFGYIALYVQEFLTCILMILYL